jgi:hypothetical protein
MSHNILMPIMNFMTRYYLRSRYKSLFFFINKLRFKTLSAILFISGVLLVISCEEKPTFIGSGILPSSDYVSVVSTDTFNIKSYTMYDYPVRSESQSTPYIGNNYDPYFGSLKCEFVTQVRLENEWTQGSYDVDSVKLFLRITSVTGSTGTPKQMRITEISNMLYTDSAYYSNSPVDTTEFGITVDIPSLVNDTVNLIQINLPPAFGEHLIRDQSMLFYSTSVEDFRSYFRGIYMRLSSVSDSDPLLIGLNVVSAATLGDYSDYFMVYMHDKSDITIRYNFRFLLDPTKENARFSRVERDFHTASPDKNIEDVINKPVLDTLSYLQGLNGVYTKIVIPGLEEIKKDPSRGKIAINKAKLTIPVHYDGENYTSSTIPQNLFLRYINSEGEKVMVPDYYVGDYHEYIDGKLDTIYNVYTFHISNFIQNYFEDTKGVLKPEIEVFQSAADIKNAIFKANNSKSPVKLEMTFTNF